MQIPPTELRRGEPTYARPKMPPSNLRSVKRWARQKSLWLYSRLKTCIYNVTMLVRLQFIKTIIFKKKNNNLKERFLAVIFLMNINKALCDMNHPFTTILKEKQKNINPCYKFLLLYFFEVTRYKPSLALRENL